MEQDYESPVRVGDLLAGKYRVDKVIGVGGMGVVVSATHEALEQKVALKFLHAELAEHPEASARFQREARAAVKIRSEHVCRVSDVGVLDTGEPYMVMEYLEGQDLGDHIVHTGPLPAHEAVDYAMQACEALAEAHAAGIVHRDLKPANLFLAGRADGTSAVKVLDFGISKLADSDISLTKTSSVMGSPQYMAPEQMQSSKRVDARTDIWALGTILYELLCGDPAFQGETVPEVAIAIVNTEPEPLSAKRPDISQDLVAIIEKCLKKNPDERYQDVAELARDLAAHGSPMSMVSAQRASRVLNTHLLGTPDSAVVSMAATQGVTGTGPHSAVRPSQPMAPVSAATGKSPSQLEVSPTVASYTDMPIGQDKKSKTGLFVGIGAAVVVVLGVGAAVAFSGGSEKPADTSSAGSSLPVAAPVPTPTPTPTPAVSAEAQQPEPQPAASASATEEAKPTQEEPAKTAPAAAPRPAPRPAPQPKSGEGFDTDSFGDRK